MNIVVLMLDSLRPGYIGYGGNSEVKTPYIDEIAKEGIFFEKAYAEYPMTIPSRIAFISGNYTFTNRPWSPIRHYDLDIVEILQKNGYTTASFSDSPFSKDWGMDRGFNIFEWIPVGKVHKAITNKKYKFRSCYFPEGDHNLEKKYYSDTMNNRLYALEKWGKACPELLFDKALEWLESNHKKKHFFLWIDSFEPHEPWAPPAPYDNLYPGSNHKRYIPHPIGPACNWMNEDDIRHVLALYMGDITHTDEMVGKVVRKIRELGIEEETLIFIISDHGEPFCEHGIIRKFGVPLYEELSRLVLIAKKPGLINKGRRCNSLVLNIDFLPTILETVGLPIPKRKDSGIFMLKGLEEEIDGKSMVPLFSKDIEIHNEIYLGAFGLRSAVRMGQWKFIDNQGEKTNELFNLEGDPEERINVINKEKTLAKEMHHKLWEFKARWSKQLSWRDMPASADI